MEIINIWIDKQTEISWLLNDIESMNEEIKG